MSLNCETSYCELRKKEVINSCDGKRLGKIIDLIISLESNTVQGIVVPFGKATLFSKQQSVFIPFSCISKIGEDIIIVNIVSDAEGNLLCKATDSGREECKPEHHEHHEKCDGRCEKCMLYDCERRWQH